MPGLTRGSPHLTGHHQETILNHVRYAPLEGAKLAKKNQHVVPRDGGWAVRGEGNSRASSTHQTQKGAIGAAREQAQKQGSEMIIHGRDGKIRERNTYGKDPHPPKG